MTNSTTTTQASPAPAGVSPATFAAIRILFSGDDLTADQADAAMMEIMRGEATQAQIGAARKG